MRTRSLTLPVWILMVLAAPVVDAAGWLDVHRADAAFDLVTARRLALEVVSEHPHSADAVVTAGWWMRQIDNLTDPGEILVVAPEERDPELGFLLARIESELGGRPPVGTLAEAELVGPFGVFENLDLERGVAPPDAALPPPDTPFEAPWKPFRLRLATLEGVIGPPEVLLTRGVFVGLWTIRLDEPADGWLAVEAGGSYELSIDGKEIASARACGQRDPSISWFRIRLDPGWHRLRADMASENLPAIRVSLIDNSGQAVSIPDIEGSSTGPWAPSHVTPEVLPAAQSLERRLTGEGDVPSLMLAAALAELRGDPAAWREWLARAVELAPDDPWPHLGLAWFWLTAPTGDDADTSRRRAREHLRRASEIPMSLLAERGLALRERRDEDHDRILGILMEDHDDDVRVLRLMIGEAVKRGWVREAEDGLHRLNTIFPGSRHVAEIELDVLEALERWQERQILLQSLAATEPLDLDLVGDLASGCLVAEAVRVMSVLLDRAKDPDLELELVRLYYSAGELEKAAARLDSVRSRWGSLRAVDEMALALSAGDDQVVGSVLEAARQRSPSSLELLTLVWRRGESAFYEPFRLSLGEVHARVRESDDETDAILLLDQAVERVFADGSSLYYYHGVTRALTPVGARQASRLQQLPNSHRLKIRIHKPDGSIVVPPEIGDNGGFIELDDVEPGDVVEEEYVARVAATGASRRGHLPPYVYRFADAERSFGLSEYILLVPPEVELLVEGSFEALERTERMADGLRIITWRAEGVPPVPLEPFAPPTSELLPWVSYGFGVAWQDVGDALRNQLLPMLVTNPELDDWSAPLLVDDDPEAVLTRLTNAVIDEIEPGRGVMDFSRSAGSSFSRRRGNRLGIIAATLLEAGWKVDLVMGRPRTFAGTHLLVPTFDSFTVPLLRVVRDGRELWLDLEEERRGIGRLALILQGSDGLMIPLSRPGEEVAILPELPSFPNPDLEERVVIKASVTESGSARLTIVLPIRGPQAERVLEQIRSVPTERVPLIYQQMALNFVPSASAVEGRVERVDDGIDLELSMHAPEVCRVDGGSMECRGLVFTKPLAPILAALPSRRYPLVMPVPVLQRHDLEIELPDGWTISHSPRRIETEWGMVTEAIESDGRRHASILRLELPAQTVDPETYPDFARFCHAVDELISRPPIMTRSSGKTYTPSS